MTSAALGFTPERAEPAPGARGGIAEFLLVGGATLLLFPLCWGLRAALGLDTAELAVGFLTFHAAFVINDPHFSVTYLLFYRDVRRRASSAGCSRPQRLRYWLAGFVAPALLCGWCVWALASDSANQLGQLIELMFFLVGWHYVKQGFGVLSVLSARRGVRFGVWERRVFLLHCFAGWGFAWANPSGISRQVEEKGVVYWQLPRPPALELVAGALFILSALLLVAVLVHKWRRERRLPPAAALAGFLVTIWLWTVFSSVDPLMVYLVPALHSLQYLYFVWLLRRNQARAEEGAPLFGRPVGLRLATLALSAVALGWLLLRGAPEFFDSARALRAHGADPIGGVGPTPYFAAFFAFVNIHHYLMDTVIWRREMPETKHLLANPG